MNKNKQYVGALEQAGRNVGKRTKAYLNYFEDEMSDVPLTNTQSFKDEVGTNYAPPKDLKALIILQGEFKKEFEGDEGEGLEKAVADVLLEACEDDQGAYDSLPNVLRLRTKTGGYARNVSRVLQKEKGMNMVQVFGPRLREHMRRLDEVDPRVAIGYIIGHLANHNHARSVKIGDEAKEYIEDLSRNYLSDLGIEVKGFKEEPEYTL